MTQFLLRLGALLLAAGVTVATAAPAAQPASRPASAASADDGLDSTEAIVPDSKGRQAPRRPTPLADMPTGLGFDDGAQDAPDSERVVFRRAPVRIVLPVNRERLVTFPGTVALHAPEGFEGMVQSQIIDRTAYFKALIPFATLRVVAEDINTGRQIPIDLIGSEKAKAAMSPVEVIVPGVVAASNSAGSDSAPGAAPGAARAQSKPAEPMSLDMVGLTRYAAQALYAPRRLVPATAGVRQIPISAVPVDGLYRGWRVETTPIGAWRSGQLYVTAVRFTNQGQQPIDIDLQEMRGQWLAATAQHTRLLAAGSDWGTTTVYLVCDRPFAACR